jgi:hypothetical protein
MKISGWLIATLSPFIILIGLFIQAAYDYQAGSNLWPILVIFYVPIAAAYLVILGIARWLSGRRRQQGSA